MAARVSDEGMKYHEDLLMGKYRYVMYRISDDSTQFVVDHASSETDYDKFLEKVPADKIRFVTYDFSYRTTEGDERTRAILINWMPNTAPLRERTKAAALVNDLRAYMHSRTNVHATDFSELAFDAVKEALNRR
ncbi:hypothetical protein ACFXB3_12610 [Streptomyces sp. NPDC059447]|uniref:hypothetical protein n=1 Tax=Streptomyces sp. NPDC059447 TaxID=3346834 RepID=UPI0036767AAB